MSTHKTFTVHYSFSGSGSERGTAKAEIIALSPAGARSIFRSQRANTLLDPRILSVKEKTT